MCFIIFPEFIVWFGYCLYSAELCVPSFFHKFLFLLLARLESDILSILGGIAKIKRVVGTKSGFCANEMHHL